MSTTNKSGSRRSFLRNTIAAATAVAVTPADAFSKAPAYHSGPKGLRVVHITDTHVQNELSITHTKATLDKIVKEDKPDLVFHTGDVIMDALATGKEAVAAQWKLWKELIAGFPVPIHYALGNHDVWWNKPDAADPLYGKAWALQELKLSKRYYSYAAEGWHFIFLDSIQPHDTWAYNGGIDPEQMTWLEAELKELPPTTPVLISSHIPLLSAAVFDLSEKEKDVWQVPGSLVHGDSHEVQKLLRSYPNIKGCISGHLHLLDTVIYDKIHYLGCGAVSANWWKTSAFHQTNSGYSVIDLRKDGSFSRTYKQFPWS